MLSDKNDVKNGLESDGLEGDGLICFEIISSLWVRVIPEWSELNSQWS